MEIVVGGTPLSVKPSRGKKIRIKVDFYGNAVLFLPRGVPLCEGQKFAERCSDWLAAKVRAAEERKRAEADDEDSAVIFGKRKGIVCRNVRSPAIEGEFIVLPATCLPATPARAAALDRLRRDELYAYVAKRLPEYESMTGLKAESFGIRAMRSRWGSCNTLKKTILFSVNLAKKPAEAIDYVILHEVCHLRHPDHGAMFKQMLSRYMPDWKKIKIYNGM